MIVRKKYLGNYDLEIIVPSHRMVDINGELANKKQIYYLTQNITNWPSFKIPFRQKEECLCGESIAGVGVNNSWDHPYITSHVNKQNATGKYGKHLLGTVFWI